MREQYSMGFFGGGHRFGAGLKPPQEGVTFLLYRFPFSFGVLDTGRF